MAKIPLGITLLAYCRRDCLQPLVLISLAPEAGLLVGGSLHLALSSWLQ